MKVSCVVFKSAKQPDTYLYLPKNKDQEELPAALRDLLGEVTPFLSLDLHPEKKLARVRAKAVIQAINENGFYLQMPAEGGFHSQEPAQITL